eukprot:5227443-Prorocentrum_lima.AAC.1
MASDDELDYHRFGAHIWDWIPWGSPKNTFGHHENLHASETDHTMVVMRRLLSMAGMEAPSES